MAFDWTRPPGRWLGMTIAVVLGLAGGVGVWKIGLFASATAAEDADGDRDARQGQPAAPPGPPSVDLSDAQLHAIKVGPVGEHAFPLEKNAVGSIDFNEDLSVQVFTPYQGKIIQAFVQVGATVQKGQPLFTIDSPDLVQAESTLISSAGVFDLTSRALARAKMLYSTQGTGGIAQKDVDQAVSDKQTAEGALKAARDAVRVFGKKEPEIDELVAQRRIDPVLVVYSPIAGKVTARDAQPGLLVQPGNAPAPYTITDTSSIWMLASVSEADSALIKLGEPVSVATLAYPGHIFQGTVTTIGATVDPNLHTFLVRSEIEDPQRLLRSGMFASFVIRTGDPVTSLAVPLDGVVREGDGTMTVWVTRDRHHFTQRVVTTGLQNAGYRQILDGLRAGELVVTDGAIFLDNMLTPVTD